eukprot:jgi/Tetstr1/454769/TSEL_041652.t1
MRLMRRRAFDFQTCGLCQHTFPAPESNADQMPNYNVHDLARTIGVVLVTAKDVARAMKQLQNAPELKQHQEVVDDVMERFAREHVPEELVKSGILHTGEEGERMLDASLKSGRTKYHRSAASGKTDLLRDAVCFVHDPANMPTEERMARTSAKLVMGTAS